MSTFFTTALTVLVKEGGLGYLIAVLAVIAGGCLYYQKHKEVLQLMAKVFELSQTVTATLHVQKQTESYIHELTDLTEKTTQQLTAIHADLAVLKDRGTGRDRGR